MWRGCFPDQVVRSAPPLPHVRGSPALRVLPAGPTSTAVFASLRMVHSVGILDRPCDQDCGGSPRSLDASFSVRAVLSDPAGVSGTLAITGAYCCLPRFRPCRPPGHSLTRLNRFPCSTARTSPCLRLAHVVTSMSPRLGSRWVAGPCRGGNRTRWTRQVYPGAPK
jgi:hypothetical protein